MTLSPGTKLGPYEIVAPLGAGGMGEVYRARDRKLDREVALKVLPQAVASDADRLARFEREARTLAAVNHPNIAQVFGLEDGGADGGPSTSAIVMELVDGEDLSAIIARGPIPVGEVIAMARQIAEALEAAHEQGIVHRDLKPGNVKVRPDGTVKVLDFGLAKAVEAAATAGGTKSPTITSPAMTHAGVVLGTAAYMAPEQAKGKVVDRRADIWSFGAVLYEMLTGMRAFPGEDVTDTIVSIMSREPDWSQLPADAPQSIRTLLKRMLDKDARRRLRDAGEARVALDDVLSGRMEVPQAVPVPAIKARLWRRVLPVAATAIVVAMAAYAAWRMRPLPVMPVVRFSMTMPDDFQFTRTSSRMIDVSRDGSRIAYLGDRQLYVRSLSDAESRVIPGSIGLDPASPFFSPDGQWVGFLSVAEAALKKVSVAGGASVKLCPITNGVGLFQGGVWDGDTIYLAQQGTGIMRVSANGGEPELVAAVESNQSVYGPSFLPGGRSFLMAITSDPTADRWDLAEIVAYTPSTGERKTVLRGGAAPRYVGTGHLVYATGSTLLAVPFDPARLEVSGGAMPVVEDVRRVLDAASGAAQFAVSQSGTMAYIPGTAANPRLSVLALAPTDGSGKIQTLPTAPGQYSSPKISPDGRQIAVLVNDDSGFSIWVGDFVPPSPLRRLTAGPRDRGATWTADSRFVLFFAETPESGIYRQIADGSAPAERVTVGSAILAPEAAHPDGKTIVFSQGVAESDLWSVSAGSAPHALVVRPGFQRFAAFSPDGRSLAYTSRQEGRTDIFVEPFPPNGALQRLSTGGGTGPRWSPTGTDIFYQVNAGLDTFGSGKLMRIPVRTTPTFAPTGTPVEVRISPIVTAVFANFDITRDGKHVLVVMPARGALAQSRPTAQQIRVVVNWLDELKAKVPTQ
jgi:serine/threonine-protein kinase